MIVRIAMSSWDSDLMFSKVQLKSFGLLVGIIIACQSPAAADAKTILSSAVSPLTQAEDLARQGKLAEARQVTEAYLARNPKSLEALAFQGTLSEGLADYSGARESYKRLLALAPDVWQARLGLARCNLKLTEYRAAVQELLQLSQEYPQEPKIWLNLATARLETGELDDAEDAAKRAILLEPDSIAAVKVLAEIKFQSGHPRYARELAVAILEREPRKQENYKFLLKCMSYTKTDPEDLNTTIDIAQDYMTESPELFYEFGRTAEAHAKAIKAGNSERLSRRKNAWYLVVSRAFDLACRQNESNAAYHLELAKVLAVLRMKQAALVEAEKARRLQPDIKYGKQLDAAVAAARRDIAGRIKVSLSGQGI